MCNFNSSSMVQCRILTVVGSVWCFLAGKTKCMPKATELLLYNKWGRQVTANEGENSMLRGKKKSQNRQEKNETDSKSPLLYMYFIWYICITFVSLCWAYFYANIMDNGLFLLCFFMMFFQPICQLLLSGCFIHVSSMIVCSCVDCSDPKLLYADIIPSGTCNVYMAWSWVGFLNMSYN